MIFLLRALSLFCFLIALERSAKADPITAVTAGVGVGGSVLGGIFGGLGAKAAARKQAEAARQAREFAVGTANAVNPTITGPAEANSADIRAGSEQQAQMAKEAAARAAAGMTEATTSANKILDPYAEAGADATRTLQTGLVSGGDFNKVPTLEELQMDPGYAFRLEQGQKALERSAAARGRVLGGGTLKDLTTFAQGTASQEYQNAFNRFRQSTQDRFARLFDVSGQGLRAGGQQGENLIGNARYGGNADIAATTWGGDTVMRGKEFGANLEQQAREAAARSTMGAGMAGADLYTQEGNARAAGTAGLYSGIGSGIAGGANAATSAILLRNLLKNPTPLNYIARPRIGATPSADTWP